MEWNNEVTATLRAAEHIHQPVVVYDANADHGYKALGDTCETIRSAYGTGGGNMPIVVIDMTHANDVVRCSEDGTVPTLQARMGMGGESSAAHFKAVRKLKSI